MMFNEIPYPIFIMRMVMIMMMMMWTMMKMITNTTNLT